MKYKRSSVFIIICIFLLISAQFASAETIRTTLRTGETRELNYGYSVTLIQIYPEGDGSAHIELRRDGVSEGDMIVEHMAEGGFIVTGGSAIGFTLINVVKGITGDYSAQFNIRMPDENGPVADEYFYEDVPEELSHDVSFIHSFGIMLLLAVSGFVGMKISNSSSRKTTSMHSTMIKPTKEKHNHIMNFILGFFVGTIIAITWTILHGYFDRFDDIQFLLPSTLRFGITCGIIGFTVSLIINFKENKLKSKMKIVGFFICVMICLIISFIISAAFFVDIFELLFYSIIIIGASVVLRTSRFYKKNSNNKMNQTTPKSDIRLKPRYETSVKPIEEKQIDIPINPEHKSQSLNTIEVKSAFSYKGATILYKIKVENPTPEPIGDIKVNLYVPDVFLVSESTKSIAMLKPSESKTATFEIRPTGECGDCEVSGKVVYYDYSTKKTSEIEIPAKNLSIVCPMLHSKEISEDAWRSALSGFAKAEESTKEIDMPASTLFDITTDILQDMNLYMLEPKINDSSDLYRAVAKFYGEGVKELKYAAQIEVVGGAKKSKLILKSWAEREDALTGFYHGVLDEIEKRVHVKGYINDNIVQHVHNYGDNIGTQVKDSLVQRSNIGTGTKKCVNCGTDANLNEKFCNECGTKFE